MMSNDEDLNDTATPVAHPSRSFDDVMAEAEDGGTRKGVRQVRKSDATMADAEDDLLDVVHPDSIERKDDSVTFGVDENGDRIISPPQSEPTLGRQKKGRRPREKDVIRYGESRRSQQSQAEDNARSQDAESSDVDRDTDFSNSMGSDN